MARPVPSKERDATESWNRSTEIVSLILQEMIMMMTMLFMVTGLGENDYDDDDDEEKMLIGMVC